MKNYTIDATNKTLGRLASEVAAIIQGKNDPSFVNNALSGNTVTVTNVSKLKIDPRKMQEKTYNSFSGYPGGLKQTSMAHMTEKKGYGEIFIRAVKGMLPDNKLKAGMLKALTVTE